MQPGFSFPEKFHPIIIIGAGGIVNDAHLPAYTKLFLSYGDATKTITTATKTTSIKIRASGDQCYGAPTMRIKIDGVIRLYQTVSATTWTTYSVATALNAGNHSVVISFTNDYYSNKCDRNLRVDTLTLQ